MKSSGSCDQEIHLVWVQDRAELMGVYQSIPWKLLQWEEEVQELVATHSVIVGRQAYLNRYHKLKAIRRLVVLASSPKEILEGHEWRKSSSAALKSLKDEPKIFILGGCRTLKTFYPLATHLHITEVTDSDVSEVEYQDQTACYAPEVHFNDWIRLTRRGFRETDEGVVYTQHTWMRNNHTRQEQERRLL